MVNCRQSVFKGSFLANRIQASLIAVAISAAFAGGNASWAQSNPNQQKPGQKQSNAKQSGQANAQKKATAQKKSTQQASKTAKKKSDKARVARVARNPDDRMSDHSRIGVQSAFSEAKLNSSAVLVMDQISGEVLVEKNPDAILPIASITKLMTALVVAEADLSMNDLIEISQEDADLEKGVKSRLRVGTLLSRGELMHLALMSSENRAAHALGRTYPGGMNAFVDAMNIKAAQLGMTASRFVEPTGLNAGNVASPRDLARLVEEAYLVPLIREYSTANALLVRVGGKQHQFRNSNSLVRADTWELGLSKTGFIREAGRCLVMQAEVERRPVIVIMLDAAGKQQRVRDAEMIRRWLIQQAETKPPANRAAAAPRA